MTVLTVSMIAMAALSCGDRSSGSSGSGWGNAVERRWPVPEAAPGGEPFGSETRARLEQALATKPAGYVPRTGHLGPDGSPRYTNRLILETSPYLLQHAHNPVDWRPWGEETFAAARRLNRPILLSIGYSTCHWCHVMEHESFEDVEIASFINANYVPIKVDREERPDVDGVYMNAVQLMTGRGGWPLTALLTPDREVFFAGTYFPPRDGDRGAPMGFLTILQRIADGYRADPAAAAQRGQAVTRELQRLTSARSATALPGAPLLGSAVDQLATVFDPTHGGFGGAPKFPRPVMLEFLLRYHRRTGDARALTMAIHTLERMAAGGMYDHVGGGFHRYSTDARWLVPHFEKMLYDNAQLVPAYLEAYQVTGDARFAGVARDTLGYLQREMRTPEGGFYAATDADSRAPDGESVEGWFFTWTPQEIEEALGAEQASLVIAHYGATDEGHLEGRSVLHLADAELEGAGAPVSSALAGEQLEAVRRTLYAVRAKRPPPATDTKVLADWNGLTIAAFARAARVLRDPTLLEPARAAARLVLSSLQAADGSLARTWQRGAALHRGVLDDYAFVVAGLLELFEAEGDPAWMQAAVRTNAVMLEKFRDPEAGDFFFTAADAEPLLVRAKPDYDGAVPAGSSVAIANLLKLHALTGEDAYRVQAEQALRAVGGRLERDPLALPKTLSALDFWLDRAKQIVLVVGEDEAGAAPFLDVLARSYQPNAVVVLIDRDTDRGELERLVPLARSKIARDGRTTAYVCENQVCDLPTQDPAVFAKQLAKVEPYP